MSHVYRLILVMNVLLLPLLIFLAYKEKKKLTGEKAREMVSSNWNLFRLVIGLALLGLLIFLVHESREFAVFVFNAELLPIEEEVEIGIAVFVFLASLVNLYIILKIIKEKEASTEAAK